MQKVTFFIKPIKIMMLFETLLQMIRAMITKTLGKITVRHVTFSSTSNGIKMHDI